MSASCHVSMNTDTRACAHAHTCAYALRCARLPVSCPEYYRRSPTDSHSFSKNLKVQNVAPSTSAGRKHRQRRQSEENPSSPRRQAQIAIKTAKPLTEASQRMGQCKVTMLGGKSHSEAWGIPECHTEPGLQPRWVWGTHSLPVSLSRRSNSPTMAGEFPLPCPVRQGSVIPEKDVGGKSGAGERAAGKSGVLSHIQWNSGMRTGRRSGHCCCPHTPNQNLAKGQREDTRDFVYASVNICSDVCESARVCTCMWGPQLTLGSITLHFIY